jgi:hypothetical protein
MNLIAKRYFNLNCYSLCGHRIQKYHSSMRPIKLKLTHFLEYSQLLSTWLYLLRTISLMRSLGLDESLRAINLQSPNYISYAPPYILKF